MDGVGAPAALPALTFVVAAYNAAQTLPRTLGSLATVAGVPGVEILVIDDGSTDDTARIAENFCRISGSYRLLRQANRGLGAVRNRGVAEARGQYITFCDADDIFLPANHHRLLRRMIAEGADVGIGLAFNLMREQEVIDFWDNALVRRLARPGTPGEAAFLKFLVQASVCSKIFRRDYVVQAGARFTEGRLYEDLEFTTFALLRTERLCFEELPLFFYDIRGDGSLTSGVSSRRLEVLANIEPVIAALPSAGLSGTQLLGVGTALMRTALWCFDHAPDELLEQFKHRLLAIFTRDGPRPTADDRARMEPTVLEFWDRRAFGMVCAVWLSGSPPAALARVLDLVRRPPA